MSWAFVFGAVGTLLYTSFKPFWSDLMSGEFPPDQIQGTMIDARDASPDVLDEPASDLQLAEALNCPEHSTTEEDCTKSSP